jgi:hypothetical protein
MIAAPPLPDRRPYVVARAALMARLDLAPLGRSIAAEDRFDPTRRESARFLDRLERLDALRYGALGMKSPRWALYDCAALPGAIAGFGARAHELSPALRAALGAGDDEETLAPLSMVVATPMHDEGHWLLSAMGALDDGLPAALSMALGLLRARRATVTAQWRSDDLAVLAAFAPLEILAAWLPAHDHPATSVLELDLAPEARSAGARWTSALAGGAAPLDVADERALRSLQNAIESGARARLVGPPRAAGASSLVPVALEAPR